LEHPGGTTVLVLLIGAIIVAVQGVYELVFQTRNTYFAARFKVLLGSRFEVFVKHHLITLERVRASDDRLANVPWDRVSNASLAVALLDASAPPPQGMKRGDLRGVIDNMNDGPLRTSLLLLADRTRPTVSTDGTDRLFDELIAWVEERKRQFGAAYDIGVRLRTFVVATVIVVSALPLFLSERSTYPKFLVLVGVATPLCVAAVTAAATLWQLLFRFLHEAGSSSVPNRRDGVTVNEPPMPSEPRPNSSASEPETAKPTMGVRRLRFALATVGTGIVFAAVLAALVHWHRDVRDALEGFAGTIFYIVVALGLLTVFLGIVTACFIKLEHPLTALVYKSSGGVSLSRIQAILWSLMIMFSWIHSVLLLGEMPKLPTEALILMGLTGATYLGAKSLANPAPIVSAANAPSKAEEPTTPADATG